MKKFLITFFILLGLGIAGFFLGWAHLTVPPGAYGVINSKTHGIDPRLIRSGEFRWIWYKLIPTNAKIAVLNIEGKDYNMNFSGFLPSGADYAAFVNLNADFSWDISGKISFSIDPDKLVDIVIRNNIVDQAGLSEYEDEIGEKIKYIIIRTLTSGETDNLCIENLLMGGTDPQLEAEILQKYPEIQKFSFVVQSAKIPDFFLYKQVRSLYEEFLDKQREIIADSFGKRAESHIAAQIHFLELERYGELLTKYPVLLEYLAMEKNNR